MSISKKIFYILLACIATFFVLYTKHNDNCLKYPHKVISTLSAPFQKMLSIPAQKINQVHDTITEVVNLYSTNKEMQREIEILREENLNSKEIEAENQRLRSLIDYKNKNPNFKLMIAKVIAREADLDSSSIVIDIGTVDGISNGMVVVNAQGLVGQVIEANTLTSKIQLIIDRNSSVGGIVQRAESRVMGIVKGDPQKSFFTRMINLANDADVQINDIVVTSGLGGIYPKGLLIGKIIEIQEDENGFLKSGVIEPAVNFGTLEEVVVIVTSSNPLSE